MKKFNLLLVLVILGITLTGKAQLVVDNTTFTPEQLVQNILGGPGVTISNVTLNGVAATTVNERVGYFDGTSANVGLNAGVILGSGDVQVAVGPNNQGGASMGGTGMAGVDPDLAAITPNQIYDETILEFDFIPVGDTVTFRYVFASEEYDEYVCGTVNDAFGFFISGPGFAGPYTNGGVNIALIPGTTTPVSINTVNNGTSGAFGSASTCASIDPNWSSYNIYYAGNTQNSVQYDGMTVVLTAIAAVQCGQSYHIKLAIGDAGDAVFDSGVFLEAGSFTSEGVDVNVTTITGDSTLYEGCADAQFIFTRPDTSTALTVDVSVGGNAINGVDYTFIPDSVYFAQGQATVQMNVAAFADGLPEGTDTLLISVYTINQCGDTIIKEAVLYLADPTPVVADAGPDTTIICPGGSITLVGSGSGGMPIYEYSWSTGDTTNTTSVSPLTTTSYILTVDDYCFGTDTDTVTVTVPPFTPLDLSANDVTVNCPNDPAILVADFNGGGTGPYTFLWSNGDNDTTTQVNVAVTTSFNFTVTDQCGLDSTISVTVNVPVLDTVNMDLITGSSDSTFTEGCTDAILLFTRPNTGSDLTVYIGVGGNAINGTDYTFIADSVFFAQGNDTVALTISAFQDGLTEPNDTITITMFLGNNCVSEQLSFYITEPDSLIANAGNDVNVNCPGTTVNLNGSASGGAPPYQYDWSNTATTPSTTVSPLATASYVLTITDGCGTIAQDTVLVTVPSSPPFSFTTQDETILCPGDIATLEVNFNGGGIAPYSFTWSNGDTGTVTQVTPLSSTTYNFTITDMCGQDSTITINVMVPVYAPLEISISELEMCTEDTLIVAPTTSGGAGGNNYGWYGPAGSSFSINQNNGSVQFINPVNGTYMVTVTDQCGASAADTADFTFLDCTLLIPNVISPNGDGANDVWEIKNLEYHPNTMVQIYNRWGQLLYENANYNNSWNGSDVNDGTYFYIVSPINGDGPFTGTLTVFQK